MQAVYRHTFAAQSNSGVVMECRGRVEVIGIVTLGPPDEGGWVEALQPRFRYGAKPAGFALQFAQRRELDALEFMENDQLHAAVITPPAQVRDRRLRVAPVTRAAEKVQVVETPLRW